jgi:predicted CoA-binding protein
MYNKLIQMKKKTLVFGASLKPERYANIAIHKLVNHGHEVVAFGSKKGEVAGITIDTELMSYKDIDTVTLYLSDTNQTPYYGYLIKLGPERVIFNPGTENPEFYNLLKQNNIEAEEACTLVLISTNQY